MKSICLLFVFSLSAALLPVASKALIQTDNSIILPDKQLNKDELPSEENFPMTPSQALIIGRWRGYQETPEMTIYYGYEFRPNGVYMARHRVYQGEKTILDQYWQGTWDFDGKIIHLEGTVTKGDSTVYRYSFGLEQDNLLYYQGGDVPAPYLPGKMGKI